LRVLLAILLILCSCPAPCRELYHIPIQKQDGLPSNSVYNILQDSKGYIWLATDDGLCRYDGFEYRVYKSPLQVSLAGSNIAEDKFGRIWYQNFDGYLYYVEGDTLLPFLQNSVPGIFPYCITEQHLFLVRSGTLGIYDLKEFKLVRTVPLDNYYHSVASRHEAYFITDSIVNTVDHLLRINTIPTNNIDRTYTKQVWLANSKAYICTKRNELKALYVIEENAVRKVLDMPQPELIQGLTIIDGTYWVLTAKGAFAYDSSGRVLNGGNAYFEGYSFSTIIKDRQQNYWFATTNDGILLVPDLNREILGLGVRKPNRIVPGDNEWYIGSKNDEILVVDRTFSNWRTVYKGATNAAVSFLYSDDDNLVSVSKKVNIRNKRNGSFKENLWALKDLCSVDEKYYAYATSSTIGLIHKTARSERLRSVWDKFDGKGAISGTDGIKFMEGLRAKSVAADTLANIIYFATNKGLFVATPSDGVHELKMGGVSFFGQWLQIFGSEVYGLSTKGDLYLLKDGVFQFLNDRLHLGRGSVKAIKQCGDKMFIRSEKALSYIMPGKDTLTLYETDIDVTSYDINDLALDGSTLFLATDLGIVKVDLGEDHGDVPAGFSVNSLSVNGVKRAFRQPLFLKHSENRIAINYSILDFGPPRETSLYYKVSDGPWVALSNKTRTLEFQALAPGEYSIRFSFSANESDLLGDTIYFSIEKPFWQQGWFLFSCLFAMAIIGYFYYRQRLNVIVRKNRLIVEKMALEEDLSRSMLTSIKAQMNPHFFYNALNTIQGYIFTNDRKNASNYLAKFSRLTRMILEMSGKDTISLSEELSALALYLELENMRFDNDFEFVIEVSAEVDTELIKIPSMIIQPYVENAVKHGLLHKEGKKQLSLTIGRIGSDLVVEIRDNGIGRKRSAELNMTRKDRHTPFSTEANKKRIELLNRGKGQKVAIKIEDRIDSDGNAEGTVVTLTMPVYH
jgi:hypothetical protein